MGDGANVITKQPHHQSSGPPEAALSLPQVNGWEMTPKEGGDSQGWEAPRLAVGRFADNPQSHPICSSKNKSGSLVWSRPMN